MSGRRTRRPARPYWRAWPDWLQVELDRLAEREGLSFEDGYREFGAALAERVVRAVSDAGFLAHLPQKTRLAPALARSRTKVALTTFYVRPHPSYWDVLIHLRIDPSAARPYVVDVDSPAPWDVAGQPEFVAALAAMAPGLRQIREIAEKTLADTFASAARPNGRRP